MNRTLLLQSVSLFFCLLLSLPLQAMGEWDIVQVTDVITQYIFDHVIPVLGGLIILVALLVMYRTLLLLLHIERNKILQEQGLEVPSLSRNREEETSVFQQWYAWLWSIVPVGKESEIDLGHDYDGIRELDNRLPPWWLGLMYGSVIFAVVYLYYYHWSGNEWSSREEYKQEMEIAEEQKRAYLLTMANAVDESNVEPLSSTEELAAGKTIYLSKCASCHGQYGEGGVGPNLTDPYWIHGGHISDIFSTIKYGVPEKGMISWQSQLRPKNMQQVASFILNLQGTNPPNPKDKEGILYEPDPEVAVDSVNEVEG